MSDDKKCQFIASNERWVSVRNRFLANFPPNFYPDRTIEMLDLCRASPRLRQLIPFISLGRLGLERYDAYERGQADNFVCLYFHDGRYVASGIDNEEKRFFDTAEATVAFVKEHLNDGILF
ncbi:hypothetical protein IC235_06230 [Hymenobacter sp. BT664]|uniref:Uncharacterized protein n=1 Tax=Hymenobacter montanus TaxID=2771359 RepID=A0A927GIK2_9BACT|nr:DUF6193 family natural product biosynthesis protein [Hymenobacter montanus]MBD2767487.1 hypothetical protein [Hymenobacter montanus]